MRSKIKTKNDAFKYLGEDPKLLPDVSKLLKEDRKDVLNNFILKKVVKAINKEFNGGKVWTPNFFDGSLKYRPWFWVKSDAKRPGGFCLSYLGCVNADSLTYVGSRLLFISEEALKHAVKHFPELYEQEMLYLK